jgi:DNA-damage-inducible protein J
MTLLYTVAMTTIQVRTPAAVKQNAKKILKDLGMDMSTAINIYLVQITKQGGIPFPILTENGMTPQAEEELLREEEDALQNGKVYSSSQEMFDDILR